MFIIADTEEKKKELEKLGYTLIANIYNRYYFMNDDTLPRVEGVIITDDIPC